MMFPPNVHPSSPRQWVSIFAISFFGLVLCPMVSPDLRAQSSDDFRVEITQIDRLTVSRLGVYVSVTDSRGNPIPTTEDAELVLYEEGREIFRKQLHQAQAGISEQQWVVLLLDRSGSMEGQKLREAKQAAKAFIARRNPNCEIAIVTFEDQVQVTSGFQNASNLDWVIDGIQTGGSTALQDGVAEAISLLTGKHGRKAVLLMTDGLANGSTMYPGPEGQTRVIEWARQEGVTISTIGLGDNVDANYLDRFRETGGKALLSPTPQELVQAFHIQQDLLESELYFELESSLPPNGARRSIKAVLKMGSQSVDSPQTSYVGFGFIPLVRGNHLPFLWAVLGLLALPEFLQIVTGTLRTWNFRRSNVRCLGPGDMHLGKRDRNTSPDAPGFQVGEWVVQCPSCSRPHHTRSWRYNHCHCPQGDGGAGSICHARYLPTWLRRTLNWLSGPWRESENGPRFRCRCAGDKDGF